MKAKILDSIFFSKLTLKILPRVDWRQSDSHDKYVRWAERRPWETGTEEVYWSTLPLSITLRENILNVRQVNNDDDDDDDDDDSDDDDDNGNDDHDGDDDYNLRQFELK